MCHDIVKVKSGVFTAKRLSSFIAVLALLLVPGSLLAQKVPLQGLGYVGVTDAETPYDVHYKGSCSLVGKRHVLTCCHVLCKLPITINLGDEVHGDAELVALDLYNDWALFRLKRDSKQGVLPVTDVLPAEGEKVYMYGHGGKFGYHELTFRSGRLWGTTDLGDSGGPVINLKGQQIAVGTAKINETREIFGNGIGKLGSFVRKWSASKETMKVANAN